MLTSYQFASNTPIMAIDFDGLEAVVVTVNQWINPSTGQLEQTADTHIPGTSGSLDDGILTIINYLDLEFYSSQYQSPVFVTATNPGGNADRAEQVDNIVDFGGTAVVGVSFLFSTVNPDELIKQIEWFYRPARIFLSPEEQRIYNMNKYSVK